MIDPRTCRIAAPQSVATRLSPKKPAVAAAPKEAKRVVRIEGAVSVGELARHARRHEAPEVQRKAHGPRHDGLDQPGHRRRDRDARSPLNFGYEVEDVGFREEKYSRARKDRAESIWSRAPR